VNYSRIKKDLAKNPGLWVLFRQGRRFLVSIGDPGLKTSRLVHTFPNREEFRYYVRDLLEEISENQILDLTGENVVSKYYTQWYVDNILR
jgi:hypothetical protein